MRILEQYLNPVSFAHGADSGGGGYDPGYDPNQDPNAPGNDNLTNDPGQAGNGYYQDYNYTPWTPPPVDNTPVYQPPAWQPPAFNSDLYAPTPAPVAPPAQNTPMDFLGSNSAVSGSPYGDYLSSGWDQGGVAAPVSAPVQPYVPPAPTTFETPFDYLGASATQGGAVAPPIYNQTMQNGAPSVDEIGGYNPFYADMGFGSATAAPSSPYLSLDEWKAAHPLAQESTTGDWFDPRSGQHFSDTQGPNGFQQAAGWAGDALGSAWNEFTRDQPQPGAPPPPNLAPDTSVGAGQDDYLNAAKLRDLQHQGAFIANDGRILQGPSPAEMMGEAKSDYAARNDVGSQLSQDAVAAGGGPPLDASRGNLVNSYRYSAEASQYVGDLERQAGYDPKTHQPLPGPVDPSAKEAALVALKDMGFPVQTGADIAAAKQKAADDAAAAAAARAAAAANGPTQAQLDAYARAYASGGGGSGGGSGSGGKAMTDYEKAVIANEQQRIAISQQQQDLAKQTAEQNKQNQLSGAFQAYRASILSAQNAPGHKYGAQLLNSGYLPGPGGVPVAAPMDPMVAEYYKAHPELGPVPGTGLPPTVMPDVSLQNSGMLQQGQGFSPVIPSAQQVQGLGSAPANSNFGSWVNDMSPVSLEQLLAQSAQQNQQATLRTPTKFD